MSILELFGWQGDRKAQTPAASPADTETVRKIAAELDRLEPEKARFIAAFAYILSRVARADLTSATRNSARWKSSSSRKEVSTKRRP